MRTEDSRALTLLRQARSLACLASLADMLAPLVPSRAPIVFQATTSLVQDVGHVFDVRLALLTMLQDKSLVHLVTQASTPMTLASPLASSVTRASFPSRTRPME